MRLTICIAAAIAALAVATPACAQGYVVVYWTRTNNVSSLGWREHNCMKGKTPKPSDLAEARAGATESLQHYLHLAANPAPVDATAAFSRTAEARLWLRNGIAGTPVAVDDPLARALAARTFALPEPSAFYRSSDGVAALGIWRIAGEDNVSPAGSYRALFRRDRRLWALERLELVEGTAEPGPASQFCHVPGDLEARAEAHRASLVEEQVVRSHKQAERASAADKRGRMRMVAQGK
jgi:hypothetical protein